MNDTVLQIVANVLVSAALYSLVAFSVSICYYPSKFFHIAHAAVISFGAYFIYFLYCRMSIPFAPSIILAVTLGVCIGMLCEILVYREMRRRKAVALTYLIASIGLYVFLQNCISIFFGDDTKIINKTDIALGRQVFGAYITIIQIVTFFISTTLFVLVNLFLNLTATGKSIRAVASNPELCNIYGISSNKVILIAFTIGSALAAIAGVLSAMDTNMTPTFGFNMLLYGVVAMIIGGVGSTKGLVGGALMVATTRHLAAFYIDTKWMDAFAYIILILFLIWKPLGFSGKRLKKVEV